MSLDNLFDELRGSKENVKGWKIQTRVLREFANGDGLLNIWTESKQVIYKRAWDRMVDLGSPFGVHSLERKRERKS